MQTVVAYSLVIPALVLFQMFVASLLVKVFDGGSVAVMLVLWTFFVAMVFDHLA